MFFFSVNDENNLEMALGLFDGVGLSLETATIDFFTSGLFFSMLNTIMSAGPNFLLKSL